MENLLINNQSVNTFDVSSINRIVCIMSFTSSASCLMSSLLDNHPNILSFPDNVLASFSEFWQEFNSLSLEPLLRGRFPLSSKKHWCPIWAAL